jgi:hypothetical protein
VRDGDLKPLSREDRVKTVLLLRIASIAALLGLSSAAQAAVSITVDKDTQQMTVAVDGVVRHQWPVSSGLPAYETPNGAFTAFRMEADHYSKEWDDAPMPHSIFFTKRGHAIHGTDHVRGLGGPASHGCVRLSRDNAATLFALVKEQGVTNTTVTLTGSAQTAMARRKSEVARADSGARTASGEIVVPRAPRQIVPAQPETYESRPTYDSNVVFGVDRYGRTVMIRRDPRYGYRRDYEQPYAQPSYSYGGRGGGYYYAPPRRGLFTDVF